MAGRKNVRCVVIFCLLAMADSLSLTETPPPPSTEAPVPLSCTHEDGHQYGVGDSYRPEPCAYCQCLETGEQCHHATCEPPPCPEPVTRPGDCCASCPIGACVDAEGHRYAVGDVFVNGLCTVCECLPSGPRCQAASCAPPPCSSPLTQPGHCCPSCPKGADCVDRNTRERLQAGQYAVNSLGMLCYCPPGSPSDHSFREAQCRYKEPKIIHPRGCRLNGAIYEAGRTFQPHPCTYCYCDSFSLQAYCTQPSCTPPPCPTPVPGTGACCPTCPNGPACHGMDGVDISKGQSVTYPDGSKCTCDLHRNKFGYPDLMPNCTAPVTKPPTCRHDGREYPEGKFQPDPCTLCECNMGATQCMRVDCAPAPCLHSESQPSQCCSVCVQGPDCVGRGNTMIASDSNTTYEDGEFCHCPPAAPNEKTLMLPRMPECHMPTTTTTTTTTAAPTTTTTRRPRVPPRRFRRPFGWRRRRRWFRRRRLG